MARSTQFANRKKVYKYVHDEDVSVGTSLSGRSFENEWLRIEDSGLIVVKGSNQRGYAWDGCSPKVNFLHLIWGTADGQLDFRTDKPFTYYASMVHDVLYQFKSEVPVSRKEADILFSKMLRKAGFMWWWLYGFAVRVGGGFYGGWKTTKSGGEVIKIAYCSWPTTDEEVMAMMAGQQLREAGEREQVSR